MKYGILYTDQNGDSHFKDSEVGFELVPGRLTDHGYSKALCRRNLSSLAWLGEGSEFFFAQVGLKSIEGMWADHFHW